MLDPRYWIEIIKGGRRQDEGAGARGEARGEIGNRKGDKKQEGRYCSQ